MTKDNCKNHADCPVRNVLAKLGDKWSLLVIQLLGKTEVMRFNELHKTIDDISQKMLTVTLRSLEMDGLVKRTVFPEVPPRVEYSITPLGKSLLPHIQGLYQWAANNMEEIMKSRLATNR
ncbi:MAG TPA: helix-turn-helix domain-containing protein [Saprospiraceae bacterium]|nr:helix-turn-helix domain-containing protein [Saprospiraceae bacterium]HPI09378.1 helix-turn-helix domain-containing protein [Saprospiraceae bacterium]